MIRRYTKWALLSLVSGLMAGLASTIFLYGLDWATTSRTEHREIVWLLPLAGLFIGWIYYRFGRNIAGGNNLIIDEIHDPKKVVPFKLAPFVLIGTVLTHLFGGSAGREGTAVQMGASLSDQLSRVFKVEAEERKILLTCGAGAGFGAAIGAPWAGVVFGMEVINVGRLNAFALFESVIASFAAYQTTLFLKAPHSIYPSLGPIGFSFTTLAWIVLAAIAFGLASRIFVRLAHVVEFLQGKISYPPLRPLIGGLILVAIYFGADAFRYAGLGIPVIQNALMHTSTFTDPAAKAVLTAITVGSGFKGGEFIPLVFIGTTLGSALSVLLPVSLPLLASLGFASVFGAAANTPLACSIMAVELFGLPIAPYALLSCYVSYLCSGHKGIYRSQRIVNRKHHRLVRLLKIG